MSIGTGNLDKGTQPLGKLTPVTPPAAPAEAPAHGANGIPPAPPPPPPPASDSNSAAAVIKPQTGNQAIPAAPGGGAARPGSTAAAAAATEAEEAPDLVKSGIDELQGAHDKVKGYKEKYDKATAAKPGATPAEGAKPGTAKPGAPAEPAAAGKPGAPTAKPGVSGTIDKTLDKAGKVLSVAAAGKAAYDAAAAFAKGDWEKGIQALGELGGALQGMESELAKFPAVAKLVNALGGPAAIVGGIAGLATQIQDMRANGASAANVMGIVANGLRTIGGTLQMLSPMCPPMLAVGTAMTKIASGVDMAAAVWEKKDELVAKGKEAVQMAADAGKAAVDYGKKAWSWASSFFSSAPNPAPAPT